MIRKFQSLQNSFGVVRQLVQFIITRFRSYVFYHFYLVELVLTNKTARIATGRTRFGTEAGSHGRQIYGQLITVNNFAAIVVGQRHFRRRNHEHFLSFNAEHIFIEFRQLTGSQHGITVDDIRRNDFRISVHFRVHIEHEVVYGPFQTSTGTEVEIKTRPCYLTGSFRIKDTQMFADFPMILRFKVEGRHVAPLTNFRVVAVIVAYGNGWVAHVGNHELNGQHLFFRFLDLTV